jgi:phosphoribosylanthranilate isomerase
MTRVKICGVQELDHALVAAQTGADYIGLVFVPGRRRRVDVDKAKAIVSGLKGHSDNVPKVVGLFADQSLEEVNRVINACQLDLVQLCGQEALEYCGQVEAEVIKVLHIPDPEDADVSTLADSLQSFRQAGHLVTLDRLVEGLQGGTGQSFDWGIAAQLSQNGHEFLLAGGLTPDNVTQAISAVTPWGVDVSSGVETGGVKDSDKIKAFVRNAKQIVT